MKKNDEKEISRNKNNDYYVNKYSELTETHYVWEKVKRKFFNADKSDRMLTISLGKR